MRTLPPYQSCLLQPPTPPSLERSFELRCFQLLSSRRLAALRCIGTTGTPEAPVPRSFRTKRAFLSGGDASSRYDRTVSRRTEPSSRETLMDEQPNPWRLVHLQDVSSRQRCTKPRGRFIHTFLSYYFPCCYGNCYGKFFLLKFSLEKFC